MANKFELKNIPIEEVASNLIEGRYNYNLTNLLDAFKLVADANFEFDSMWELTKFIRMRTMGTSIEDILNMWGYLVYKKRIITYEELDRQYNLYVGDCGPFNGIVKFVDYGVANLLDYSGCPRESIKSVCPKCGNKLIKTVFYEPSKFLLADIHECMIPAHSGNLFVCDQCRWWCILESVGDDEVHGYCSYYFIFKLDSNEISDENSKPWEEVFEEKDLSQNICPIPSDIFKALF